MNDDSERPPRKGGARKPDRTAEGRKPGEGRRADAGTPYRKAGGAKPSGGPHAEGKPSYRPRREASADAEGGTRPKREWKPREGSAEGGGRKPFRKNDGGKPPFRPRREATGDAEGGVQPKREWKPREGSAEGGGRKPFRKDDGGKPPFRPRREGEADSDTRPKREWKPRAEAGGGERKPFRKDKPRGGFDRGGEGERKPFKPRDGEGRKPFAKKPRDDDRRTARTDTPPEAGERIAKRLARAGISSRRDAETMIAAGRVRVNGEVLSSPAVNVTARDTILVDNHPLPPIERTRLFLFHKPGGVVTTNRDPEGRRTVFEVLPEGLPRLVTVGRLDINTEGLLLLTNDGGLARVLELPSTGWLRRYRARVHGRVDEKALQSLKDGIAVDGVFYGSIEATLDREQGSNAWLTLGLREGKNREVKNVLGALGLDVSRLIRVSYGPFQLGELAEGAVQELKGRMLREQLGDRLIEEAGADFEAPVTAEFPNRPVSRGNEPVEKVPRSRMEEPGEGGLIRNRKREREFRREDALGRLQTKPAGRGGKSAGGGRKERADKPFEPPRSRSSNVWMAPGARPQGKKAETETPPSPRARAEGKGEGQHRRFDKKRGSAGPSDKPQRPRGPSSRPSAGSGRGKPRKDR